MTPGEGRRECAKQDCFQNKTQQHVLLASVLSWFLVLKHNFETETAEWLSKCLRVGTKLQNCKAGTLGWLHISHSLSSSVSRSETRGVTDPDIQTGKFLDAFALKLTIMTLPFSSSFSDLFLVTTGTSLWRERYALSGGKVWVVGCLHAACTNISKRDAGLRTGCGKAHVRFLLWSHTHLPPAPATTHAAFSTLGFPFSPKRR